MRAEEAQPYAAASDFGHLVAETGEEEEVLMPEEDLADEDMVAGEQGDEVAGSSNGKRTTKEQQHGEPPCSAKEATRPP